MNILAFDTSFAACSVAVARASSSAGAVPAVLHGLFEPMATGHAERLVAMIGAVMSDAGLAFADLDRIAVTNGPGSFTGTRISVAAARALALSLEVDVVAVSSLALMAERATVAAAALRTDLEKSTGARVRLAIAVDARRGEVYVQHFDSGGGTPLSPPQLLSVAEAAILGGKAPMLLAGSGAQQVAEAARALGRSASACLPDLLPDARDLPALAVAAGTVASCGVGAVSPLYMRPADAKPQTGKSIERART